MVEIPSTSFYYIKCGTPFQVGFENLISGLNRRYTLLKNADNVLLSGVEADVEIPESSYFDYFKEVDYRNPPASAHPWNTRLTYAIYDPTLQANLSVPQETMAPDFNVGWTGGNDDAVQWHYIDKGFDDVSRYYADRPALAYHLNLYSRDLPDDDTCYPSGVIRTSYIFRQISRRLKQVDNAPNGISHSPGISGTIWPLDLDGYDMFAGVLRSMTAMNISRDFISTYNNRGLSAAYDSDVYVREFDYTTGTFGPVTKTHEVKVNDDSYHHALRVIVEGSSQSRCIVSIRRFKEYRTTNAFPSEMMPHAEWGLYEFPSLTSWYASATEEQKALFDEIAGDNITYDYTPGTVYDDKVSMTRDDEEGYYKWNAVDVSVKAEVDTDGIAADIFSKDIVVTSSENVYGETVYNWQPKITTFAELGFTWAAYDTAYYSYMMCLDFKDFLRI